MFSDKLNKSIAESVKKCMDEAKYEPAAPDPELIAKRKAREAAAAKREEERERKENEFGGGEEKKRPTVHKVAGRAYGGAAQKDDVEESVKSFSGLLESYKDGGIKALFESLQKEEASEEEFNAELKKQKAKAEGKAPQADVAAAATQGTKDMKEEVEDLEERTLTSAETAEKERIVKGMKKGIEGFKQRYGEQGVSEGSKWVDDNGDPIPINQGHWADKPGQKKWPALKNVKTGEKRLHKDDPDFKKGVAEED